MPKDEFVRTLVVGTLAAIATAAGAGATEAADLKLSGTETYVANTEATKLPDGRTVLRINQKGLLSDKDPASPFHLNSQDCVGVVILAADGMTGAGAGSCDAVDKDGDRWWIWWADSPEGAPWGVTYGTGKFAGMTGGGTTKIILQLPDRGIFSYEGTVHMK